MGEDIELTDVNGNRVRVDLYAALRAIGKTLGPGESKSVSEDGGMWLQVRRVPYEELGQ